MKRFQLWLTMVSMFSLPTLVLAQGTGGSPGRKITRRTAPVSGGKSGAPHAEFAKKGAPTGTKGAGNGNAPKVESTLGSATGGAGSGRLGKKGNRPTASARKKPPRPAQAPPPDRL